MSVSAQASTALPAEPTLDKRIPEPEGEIEEGQQPHKKYKFADEIVIDGKKVLNISSDKLFYSEPIYQRERRSRWADPVLRKSRPILH
jgi:hypothetical protein